MRKLQGQRGSRKKGTSSSNSWYVLSAYSVPVAMLRTALAAVPGDGWTPLGCPLWMGRLRLEEGRSRARGHKAGKRCCHDTGPDPSVCGHDGPENS